MKKVIIIIAIIAMASGIWYYQSSQTNDIGSVPTSFTKNSSSPALQRVPADTLYFAGGLQKYAFADYIKANPVASDTSWLTDSLSQESMEGERLLIGLLKSYMAAAESPQTFFDTWGVAQQFDSAIFSVGFLPVVTFNLDDSAKYMVAFDQLKKQQNVTGTKKVIQGIELESYLLDTDVDSGIQVELLHSVHKDYATLAVVIPSLGEEYQRIAIGADRPQATLADSGYLEEVVAKYGFQPMMLGYINHSEIINGITAQHENSFGKMLNALVGAGQGAQQLNDFRTPACQTELGAIANNWPATVFGTDSIDTSTAPLTVESRVIVESRDTVIMKALQKLRGFIPEQLVNRSDVFSMALGLDIQQVPGSLMAIWSHLTATPAQCEMLKELQSDIAQNNPAMAAMATGFIQGFKGLSMSVQGMTFKLNETTELQEIEQVDALITISADDVQMLYTNASAAQPNLAQMQFPQDGEILDFPLPIPTNVQLDSKLSRFGNHLGLSTGAKSVAKMQSLKDVPLANNGFMAFSMNYAKYFSLLNSAMSMMPMDPEQQQVFEQLQNMDLILDGKIDFTDNGIEIKAGYGPQ